MPTQLIFYRKNIGADGDIVEMNIWEVPRSRKTPEGLKYSLVYIRGGKRLIGYDNAEGKGLINIWAMQRGITRLRAWIA